MTPIIDREKTGKQIRRIMELRGLSVHDVQEFLSLGCFVLRESRRTG